MQTRPRVEVTVRHLKKITDKLSSLNAHPGHNKPAKRGL